jgi:hypothetical protein
MRAGAPLEARNEILAIYPGSIKLN